MLCTIGAIIEESEPVCQAINTLSARLRVFSDGGAAELMRKEGGVPRTPDLTPLSAAPRCTVFLIDNRAFLDLFFSRLVHFLSDIASFIVFFEPVQLSF